MAFGAIAAAVAPSIISGIAGFFSSKAKNKADARRLQKQMDFQERMSGSAYQRSMADMRKAGLNPILAYKQGGASSPPGASMPTIQELGPAISTALGTLRLKQELKNMRATERTTQEQGRLATEMREKAFFEGQQIIANTKLTQKDVNFAELTGMTPMTASSAAGLGILAVKRFGPMRRAFRKWRTGK